MQRVSEPISLSLSSRGRKAVATTCFFSTFRVFCRYKIFVRRFCALFSFFLSLSLSLSLVWTKKRQRAAMMTKKWKLPVLWSTRGVLWLHNCSIWADDERILSSTRERERREESFYFCIYRPLLWVKSENKQQQQEHRERERVNTGRERESRMRVLFSSWRWW